MRRHTNNHLCARKRSVREIAVIFELDASLSVCMRDILAPQLEPRVRKRQKSRRFGAKQVADPDAFQIVLSVAVLDAPLFQGAIQIFNAIERRHRHKEIASDVFDLTFDVSLFPS